MFDVAESLLSLKKSILLGMLEGGQKAGPSGSTSAPAPAPPAVDDMDAEFAAFQVRCNNVIG